MAALERVMQLKQMGMGDPEIIETLKQDGASPREISEALSQSQIKSAIDTNPRLSPEYSGDYGNDMHGSMMQSTMMSDQKAPPVSSPPVPEEPEPIEENQVYSQEENAPVEDYSQEYYPEYQPESGYSEYQPPGSMDIETIREICEQLIDERIEKIRNQMSEYVKFKEQILFETENSNKRLEKLEGSIEEIKMAILRKIGDYGRDIQNISKEMHTTQESFSKILDPLTDNIRELQKITGVKDLKKEIKKEEAPEKKPVKPPVDEPAAEPRQPLKRQKIDFESYLR